MLNSCRSTWHLVCLHDQDCIMHASLCLNSQKASNNPLIAVRVLYIYACYGKLKSTIALQVHGASSSISDCPSGNNLI